MRIVSRFPRMLIILVLILSACGPGDIQSAEVIEWSTAVGILNSGEVSQVIQTHDLQVTLILHDGTELMTIEPEIDAIFHEIDQCGPICSGILMITE